MGECFFMNENIIAGDKTTKPKYTYSLNSDNRNLIIGLVTDNSETLTGTADYYGITVNDLCKNDDGILFMLNDIVSDDFSAEVIGEMLVRIFSKCNFVCGEACGNFNVQPSEISVMSIIVAFVDCMSSKYDRKHYTREVSRFYDKFSVKHNKLMPLIENGKFVVAGSLEENPDKKTRRSVTRNFNIDELYDCCLMYQNFVDGTGDISFSELCHILTNLINIEGGKKIFQRTAEKYSNLYSNHNWDSIASLLISADCKPELCEKCRYNSSCIHCKNMIDTAKTGRNVIRPLCRKEYYTVEEAEEDLRMKFREAVNSDKMGIHGIRSQTGMGKTETYINELLTTKKKYIIAVPTHKLEAELYERAKRKGVENIICVPKLPGLSFDIEKQYFHNCAVGLGKKNPEMLYDYCNFEDCDKTDKAKLKEYFKKLDEALNYDGHIIMTHERLLYLSQKYFQESEHEVIIDEDILLRTMFKSNDVPNTEIERALKIPCLGRMHKKMREILSRTGYHKFYRTNESYFDSEYMEEVKDALEDFNTDIFDFIYGSCFYNDGEFTHYFKMNRLKVQKAIVMSATMNFDVYRMLTDMDVYEYECKTAGYKGRIRQYTNCTYSRHSLMKEENLEFVKKEVQGYIPITFMKYKDEFNTDYYYGAIEGIDCLSGKDIAVIGLPDSPEYVYKLFGMSADISISGEKMRPMLVQYNGYEFYCNTFDNEALRTIHFWVLESNIEQAVGRARLLRNDCDVKVFVRFPVAQAILM